ncbi:MAG: hypothetical protein ACI9UA_001174 [Pseudoalteromonas tetraodonis]|jgi:hypothetical protein
MDNMQLRILVSGDTCGQLEDFRCRIGEINAGDYGAKSLVVARSSQDYGDFRMASALGGEVSHAVWSLVASLATDHQ